MRYFSALLSLMTLLMGANVLAASHWSTVIASRETILQTETERYSFSANISFNAARDQLFFASTKNPAFDSEIIQEHPLTVPSVIFNRFLRLAKESPLKVKIENAFSTWKDENGYTHVVVKKALHRHMIPADAAPAIDQAWLGCYDSAELCLGFNDVYSNPNLLGASIDPQEVAAFSSADIQNFRTRTAHLSVEKIENIFTQSLVPQELAHFYAIKLMSRRAQLVKEANPHLQTLISYKIPGYIQDGMLIKALPGVEAHFDFENLEVKVREFIANQYKNVEDLARYLLAHFPYMAYEYDKGLGGYSVGPGFMFRIKRKIVKNPHSTSPLNYYRINDSVEIMLTFNVGIHRSVGPASGSIGAAPGYVTKYLFSSFAPSREAAAKSPWSLTKDVVLGTDLGKLKPQESFTAEHGWMIGGVASGNVRILGQNRIRPQGNMGGSYRFLRRHYVYIEDDQNALVGFGDAQGIDLSAQAFIKVVARLAKVPVFTWSRSSLHQEGGVYRVPLKQLVDRGYIEDEEVYQKQYQPVKYSTDYQNKYFHLNVWFYRTTQTDWKGFVNFEPSADKEIGNGELNRKRKFYLMETSQDSAQRISMGHDPKNQNCGAWAAFEADVNRPETHFTDGSFRISCMQSFTAKRPLTAYHLNSISSALNLNLNSNIENIIPGANEDKQMELSWDIKMSWKDLSPLFTYPNSGWIDELAQELQKARTEPLRLTHEEAQERFMFVLSLSDVLRQSREEDKAKTFFNLLINSSVKETVTKFMLKKLKNTSVSLQVFRPLAKNHAVVEQTFTQGQVQESASFKLVEEKNKWIGSN